MSDPYQSPAEKYCHTHFTNAEMGGERLGDLPPQFTWLIHGRSSTQIWSESLVRAAAYLSSCCQSNFGTVQF